MGSQAGLSCLCLSSFRRVLLRNDDFYGVVTCEINFWSNFEIISVFYFTCNHVWNWNKIISDAEGVLKLFQNYFADNEHVGKFHELQQACEVIF